MSVSPFQVGQLEGLYSLRNAPELAEEMGQGKESSLVLLRLEDIQADGVPERPSGREVRVSLDV